LSGAVVLRAVLRRRTNHQTTSPSSTSRTTAIPTPMPAFAPAERPLLVVRSSDDAGWELAALLGVLEGFVPTMLLNNFVPADTLFALGHLVPVGLFRSRSKLAHVSNCMHGHMSHGVY
jgi:hypothetical protein